MAQVAIGMFVIGLGMLFLLDNLGFLDFEYTLHLFPMLLVLFGILKIVQARTAQGMYVGGMLVLAGLLWTLKSMGLLSIGWDTIWPVLLIAAGVSVVMRSLRAQRGAVRVLEQDGQAGDDAVINVTAIMGGYVRRITSAHFRGGEVSAVMGGCEIDLRQCSIDGEAELNVFAMFGGIQIRVPGDWSVVLQGTPILGGFDEKTVVPPDGSKRLIIKGYAIMGGLEVRN